MGVREKIVKIHGLDKETCEKLSGLFDDERGVCLVKIQERDDRPNELIIMKMRREDHEY